MIGLTGSAMTNKELECLKKVFSTTPINFPTLSQMDFDKKVHLKDEITTTTQEDFVVKLYNLIKVQC